MTQEQIDKMREQFMGKRITFKNNKGETWVGECEFLGYNQFLPSWGFQVTINRMPVSHVKPETIKLV